MKIKLSDIVNSAQALRELGAEKLPMKLAYNIQRNMRLLEPEIKSYEEAHSMLIKDKYGKKEDNGNFVVPPENMEKFVKEIMELQSVEIELDIHKIEMDDTIQIKPINLLVLSWMFNEPKEMET